MIRKLDALHQLRRLFRSWFGADASGATPYPLDACVLEDRILYSATIMPVEFTELQLDVDTQLAQLDQLIFQELAVSQVLQSVMSTDSASDPADSLDANSASMHSLSGIQFDPVALIASESEIRQSSVVLKEDAIVHFHGGEPTGSAGAAEILYPSVAGTIVDAAGADSLEADNSALTTTPAEDWRRENQLEGLSNQSAVSPTAITEPLIQYVSQGHALGFSQSSVLVASLDHVLQVEFVGANLVDPIDCQAVADESQDQDVASDQFSSVTYAGIWDGITAVYEAQEGAIFKSTYYVDAGLAEFAVDQIRLQYNRQVSLDAHGNLVIAYNNGFMTDSAPIAWQDIAGQRINVDVQYVLLGNNQVGFAVGQYDLNYQLVIDPTLTWSTFLGGMGTDLALGVAVDSNGNVYVTGTSTATWGTPLRAYSSSADVFVAKLNSSGGLLWSTFLGAGGSDTGRGISVDGSGNVYIVGDSTATWGTPVRAYTSGGDSFVVKLNNGGNLVWNTFLGAAGSDTGTAIALDSSGNIYVSGNSAATWGTPGRALSGNTDAYAAKLNNDGAFIWSTFLGGTGTETGSVVAVDRSGNVYVAGSSTVTWGSPIRAYTAGTDAFAAKLNSSGSLTWNTFLGGTGADIVNAIAVDSSGSVYLGGTSNVTWGSPIAAYSGGTDGIAIKLNSSGNIVWHTFLGGSATDQIRSIALESSGNIYLGGDSNTSWGSPIWAKSNGTDAQVVKLNNSGTRIWNTFLGGTGTDIGIGIAVDSNSYAYLVGYSTATWGSPVRTYTNAVDSFVTKIAFNHAPVLSGANNFAPITEDQVTNNGTLVSALIASQVADVDPDALNGIAITSLNSGNGIWQYSTNGGTSWNDVGVVSGTSSLLLASSNKLRFVPNGQNATTGNITFRAWDQTGATAGLQGTKVDVSINGGATAFSSSTKVASVTVTAVNDNPTAVYDTATAVEAGGLANGTAGSNGTGNVLTNDTDVDSVANGETKTVIGVAAGVQASATGSVASSVTGSYGSITINADGSYNYNVDNNNTAVQSLRVYSDTLSESFTYTIIDAAGASSTATITVSIHGADDTAVPADDNAVAVERGGVNNAALGSNATGNVLTNDSDPDAGDTQTVIGVAVGSQGSASGNVGSSITGTHGWVTLSSDGSFTYIVDENSAAVQALRLSGQTLSEVFTYTQQGSGGLQATAYLTITIEGQNDIPVAVVDNTDATEAGGLANGTAGVNPTGNVLSNDTDVDSVANGETKTVFGVAAGVQASATGSVASSVTGSYGAITINAHGSYTYVVDNSHAAVQALRTSGQTLNDVFTYTLTDDAGLTSTTQVTITIQGQNDTPTGANDSADATEAGGVANATAGVNPTGNVLANDTDVDSPANGETKAVIGVEAGSVSTAVGSVGLAVAGQFGSITINADGSYSYNVDNNNAAVQALRTFTDTLDDTFTYTFSDAAGATSTAQITVTIHGFNDSPIVATTALHTNSITPINLSAPGLLAFATDPENAALVIQLVTGPNSGTLVLQPNGDLLYTPHSEYSGTTTFVIEVSDGQFIAQATFSIDVSESLASPPPPPLIDEGSKEGTGGTVDSGYPTPGVGLDQVNSGTMVGSLTKSTQWDIGTIIATETPLTPSTSANIIVGTSVSTLAKSLDLLVTNRMMVISQINLIGNDHGSSNRQLIVTALEQLVSTQVISEEQHETAIREFDVSAESVVVTAVSTGIAIWLMYVGQVIFTLLTSSTTWLQIDPLVVLQGDTTEDDANLSAEEKLFDSAKELDKGRATFLANAP